MQKVALIPNMPRRFVQLVLFAICLTLGTRSALAQASTSIVSLSPAGSPEPDIGGPTPGMPPTPTEPAAIAPASPTVPPAAPGTIPDAANFSKFFTVTASLREEYDDNIYTTRDDKVSSFVTEFSPSILATVPMENSTFSARLTLGLDYYEHRSGDPIDYTSELLLRYTHNFSDRFSLDVRDQFGYFQEPDLLDAVGTVFRNGGYFTNDATVEFNAQWTPLFGTATTYSNISIFYQNGDIAQYQNSNENTVSQDLRFAVQPKVNLIAGGIFDDIDYFNLDRGYADYTGDIGVDWQILPSMSLGVRGGATVTTSDVVATTVSPYASVTFDWKLGKRSNLNFSYLHDVVPTDVTNAVGQEADRFSLRFNYDITARLTAHIEGIETYSNYNSSLIIDGTGSDFTENDLGIDLGAEYHLTENFGLEAGYLLSDISSGEGFRDYTRNQVYVGVRGTY
jgi:hypothetical protein